MDVNVVACSLNEVDTCEQCTQRECEHSFSLPDEAPNEVREVNTTRHAADNCDKQMRKISSSWESPTKRRPVHCWSLVTSTVLVESRGHCGISFVNSVHCCHVRQIPGLCRTNSANVGETHGFTHRYCDIAVPKQCCEATSFHRSTHSRDCAGHGHFLHTVSQESPHVTPRQKRSKPH